MGPTAEAAGMVSVQYLGFGYGGFRVLGMGFRI